MNPYIPLHFLAAFSYLCLGFYSHLQDRKAQANRVFLILCLVTALWAFCVGCVLLSPTQREADFWYFLSAPGWCFAPGLVLRFSVALIQQNRPSSWLLAFPFYIPGIVFLGQSILDFALYRAIVSFSFPLPWDLAYTAYYVISLASSILLIWRWGLQTKTKRERRQARILGTTLAVGLMLTLLNETVLPDLGVVFIPRIPAVLMLVWASGIFYAITRYRLMQLTPALTASWITSQVSDLLFLINPDNWILQINAKAAKTLGYGEKELLHQSFDVLLPSEQQGFLLQQRVDTPPEISRVILRSKAGTSIPVHVHITPFYDPAGDRLGTLFIAQDLRPLIDLETQIAEREQAEEILKQSESLYRTLAEAAQDIIFIIDESDIIHYVNNFAAQMIGKTAKGLVGQKQAALFPPEIAVVQSEHVRQVLFTGEPQYIVTHGNFPQGEMWLGTWLVPTRVDNGTVPAVMGVSRNITDEKINQERLQELLESYQKLFEAFPYGAMLITFSGTPVLMNRRMEEILAKPRQLLWREIGPKDVYPELNHREGLLRAIEQNGGRVENYPMTYRRLNGEIFPAEISVEPVQYLGRNLRLICLQDVTERQRVEEAMRLAELQWSQFLEAAPDLMWIKDLSGRYIAANQMYLDTEKRAASELIGLTDAEVYPSEDAAVYQYTDQVAIKGGVSEGEFLRKLQEELRIFWVKKVPLHTPDGKISGILGLARDVTEWKRVENALRETESQFRLLFDESPVPLWQMDLSEIRRLIEDLLLQGIPDISAYFNDQPNEFVRLLNCKHLVRVNKEGLRLFDASSIEELEAGFSSLFPPESVPCIQEGLEALLAGQGENQAEIPVCTLTGEARFASVRLVLSPGSEVSWQNTLISFQDVTARHQAEQALRESEERYRHLFEDAPIPLWEEDLSDLRGFVNQLLDSGIRDLRAHFQEHPTDLLTCLQMSKNVMVNRAGLDFFGAPTAEALLVDLPRLFPKQAQIVFQEQLLALLEGRTHFQAETMIDTLQGDHRIVNLRMTVASNNQQRWSRILLSFSDITQIRHAEGVLRKYQLLAENARDIILFIGAGGRILEANQAALDAYGYSGTEFSALYISDLRDPEMLAPQLEQIDQITPDQTLRETNHRRKNGQIFPVEVSAHSIKIGGEQVTFNLVRDITLRKQTQESLRRSELQYHSTIDALADIISVSDRQGRILLVNETFLRWNRRWNLPLDVIGKSLYELFPFLSEQLPQEYEQVFRTGEPLSTEEQINFAGEEIFVETRKIPILEEGEVKKVVTIIRDVTERKRAEEALRESKERLELVLIGGSLGFYDWDLQAGGGYADELYLSMLGYAPGEIDLGCRANWEQQVHPDDLHFANHPIRSDLWGETAVYDEEYRMRHKSGEWVWVRDRSQITARGADGRPLRVTGIHENITERKRAEAALRESEERFRQIFQSGTDCIFIKNRSLQYIEVNPAMERLLNSSSSLLVGKSNEDLFGPEAVKLVETDRRALAGETVESEDVLWVQGVPYTFLTVKMPLRNDTGSIVGVIGIARNISERARVERELDRNRERLEEIVHDRTVALEKTNVALKALAQKLVETQETERREIARELHDDIGQELTGLKLLLERSCRKAPTELRSSLTGADGLVSGILTKIRDMALNLRPSMLDDLGLLPALLYQFERFTTHTHIEIKFQHIGVEIRFPPEIETAAFRIIQEALTNVARHAKTSEVWITVEKQGEELWLMVTDQGVGFNPEQELAGGDNTGLKGIRERVSAIGGSFVLESTPGCGSLLKVQLPLWEKGLDSTT